MLIACLLWFLGWVDGWDQLQKDAIAVWEKSLQKPRKSNQISRLPRKVCSLDKYEIYQEFFF